MTELKQLANEAKRFDGGDWYLAKYLVTDWKMDKQDAAYIAAASPDVVLALINDLEKHRALLLTHLAVIDPMREQAKADEALMREALEAMTFADYVDIDMARSIVALKVRLEGV